MFFSSSFYKSKRSKNLVYLKTSSYAKKFTCYLIPVLFLRFFSFSMYWQWLCLFYFIFFVVSLTICIIKFYFYFAEKRLKLCGWIEEDLHVKEFSYCFKWMQRYSKGFHCWILHQICFGASSLTSSGFFQDLVEFNSINSIQLPS